MRPRGRRGVDEIERYGESDREKGHTLLGALRVIISFTYPGKFEAATFFAEQCADIPSSADVG